MSTANIQKSFKQYLDAEDIVPLGLAQDHAKNTKFSRRNLEKFCKEIRNYEHHENFEKRLGFFLSAYLNKVASLDKPLVLDLRTLEKKPDDIGGMLVNANLEVKANRLGDSCASNLENSIVKIDADVGCYFAFNIKESLAELNGNMPKVLTLAGAYAQSSHIILDGNVGLCPGMYANNSLFTFKRDCYGIGDGASGCFFYLDYDEIPQLSHNIGEYFENQFNFVFHKGILIYDGGRLDPKSKLYELVKTSMD